MLNIVWGSNKDKPEAAKALAEALAADGFDITGYLYVGYPIIGSPLGPVKFDALLISIEHGLVAFDLVEAYDLGDYQNRLDEIASMLDVKLKPYPALKQGRNLKFPINTFTFAPSKRNPPASTDEHIVTNRDNLVESIKACNGVDEELYAHILAAIQVVTTIRTGRSKREPQRQNSRAAKLKKVEETIANLDQHQSRAVIETVEGVQRIRGLAGSGKTIVLALKVAYLHSQNPEWHMAVTFNTRSLKEQFKRLINLFTIEQTNTEPDWEKIDVINAWGGPGNKEQDGIYHKYCRAQGIQFIDFGTAKEKYGNARAFTSVVSEALASQEPINTFYDVILVDEAQDFPPEFLRLCHNFLNEPKRLVYAYDELQSLTGNAVLPPEQLFGKDQNGRPLVNFDYSDSAIPRQDIILEKCYRNPRPILTTAHALGFGLHRDGGPVQLFDNDSLWLEVGYTVTDGVLEPGRHVTLTRTAETSPAFLEDHSPIDDLLQFASFENSDAQAQWLFENIKNDILVEELRPEDIVVINPDPLTTQQAVGKVRQLLFKAGINSEIAGVSTSRDVFSKIGSVTFTGIFRAKGNEAGMVYVINAHDCFTSFTKPHLALTRNRLFTALTRSKAWVRVSGVGVRMDALTAEWQRLKDNDFSLSFQYPTIEEKRELRLINVDTDTRRMSKERSLTKHRDILLDAIASGDIDPDQLFAELSAAKRRGRRREF